MSMKKTKVFLVRYEQYFISEVSEGCQVNVYDLWSERNELLATQGCALQAEPWVC